LPRYTDWLAEKYDGIVFTDMDDNILSEQFTEETNNDITNNTNIRDV